MAPPAFEAAASATCVAAAGEAEGGEEGVGGQTAEGDGSEDGQGAKSRSARCERTPRDATAGA